MLPILRDENLKEEAREYQKKMSKWVTKSVLVTGANWEELNEEATPFDKIKKELGAIASKFKAAGAMLTK